MHPRQGAVALIMLFAGQAALAQSSDKNPLAEVKHLNCTFSVYSIVSWKGGKPEAQVKQPERLSVEIDEIDVNSGSGRVVGAAGPVDVTALLTIGSLHFLERSVTGTLNVTSVFVSDGGAKTFRAVQSRHDYLPMSVPNFVIEPSVSQHYGMCAASE
jgi:hypothetical protein